MMTSNQKTISVRRTRVILASLLLLVLSAVAGLAQTPMPQPVFTGFDNSGLPAVNAKLCVYVSGTTTPATTYTDATLTVPNLNPVHLDGAGRAPVFLASGQSYKFALYSAGSDQTCSTGTLYWTADGITAVPTTSANLDVLGTAGEPINAGQPVYLSDGSGSKIAGQWYRADATNAYSSITNTVGMAPNAIATSVAGTIRLSGSVPGLGPLVIGTPYYVAATPGTITATAPSFRRLLGTADTTATLILTTNPPATPLTNTVTTTSTGSVNDFAPGLISGAINYVRCNNASDLTITGLLSTGIGDGTIAVFETIGAGNVFFANASGSSATGDKFANIATSGNTPISTGGFAFYKFGATSNTWRLLAHEQGAWITRTFAAGNYTASAGTWTVASATRDAYRLAGRTLQFNVVVVGTTSGTPVTVSIALPFGNASVNDNGTAYISNNGAAGAEGGYWGASTSKLNIQRYANATFASGTVSVNASTQFEVQ